MSSMQSSSPEITIWHDVGITITDRRIIVGSRAYPREEIRTAAMTLVPANRKPAIIMAIVAASVFVLMAGAEINLKHIAPLGLFVPAYLMWISAKPRYVVHIHIPAGSVEVFSSEDRQTAQRALDILLTPDRLLSAPAPAPPNPPS